MRIFKNKLFSRWATEVEIEDSDLVKAVREIGEGLYEANLGGFVYKKRVPLCGRGKSGGARTIIAYKLDSKAIFIYGFAKNKMDNITVKEKHALKELAKIYFNYDHNQINHAVKVGELVEVKYE
ncbi:MAG TPA: type II toxin-antitoxin system RelE/ParE family toxin [Gammaproteobacteria bacterium]|nr:type II toxin-antitoxin system RelE/ParE family toxin [Gammaproteobacteria bacterium]